MVTIILATLIGVVFTLVAIENSQVIAISFFGNAIMLPVYLILAITFLGGTLITGIFSLFDWTSTALDFSKKESNYKKALRANDDLRKDIRNLNSENIKLKEELNLVKTQYAERKNRDRKENIKNFFHRFTRSGNSTPSQVS